MSNGMDRQTDRCIEQQNLLVPMVAMGKNWSGRQIHKLSQQLQ